MKEMLIPLLSDLQWLCVLPAECRLSSEMSGGLRMRSTCAQGPPQVRRCQRNPVLETHLFTAEPYGPPWGPLSLYLNVILFHLSRQMRRSMLSRPIVRKGFDRRASEWGGERYSNIQAEENIQSRSHGDIWMVDSCRVNIYLVPLHSGKWQEMSKVNWLFVFLRFWSSWI